MDLSIIILNYKTKGLLKQCLRGITDGQLPLSHEVIVVDNHSCDGSAEMVREEFPEVRLIHSPRNVGFAAGMNRGYTEATGRYILILNPDVAIFGTAVERLLKYLQTHPTVGVVGPKLINPDGTTQFSCYRFPSPLVPVLRRTPLGHVLPARRILRRYLMSDWRHDQDRPVGWLLGACMLFKREAIAQVGFFDERFFLYFEDVDICRRFWQGGWEVHYVAAAEMVHYHQRLSAESPGLQGLFAYPTRVHIKSGLKYFSKYAGASPPPHHL